MAEKIQKTKQEYRVINVRPEIYAHVRMIADANGYDLGAQIEAWADRELPECEHEKESVTIEKYDNSAANSLAEITHTLVTGWFCPTCKRVYQKVTA